MTYTDELDAEGNLIVRRRHHPAVPKRSRPMRFRPLTDDPPAA